jgi:hypothetical protein
LFLFSSILLHVWFHVFSLASSVLLYWVHRMCFMLP